MLIAAWCNEFIWRIKKIFIFAKCHKIDYILLFYLSTEFKHGVRTILSQALSSYLVNLICNLSHIGKQPAAIDLW